MLHQFSRNELVIGQEGLNILKNSRVGVLGMGGVGTFAVEALARSGVGSFVIMDKDSIDITNVNRQIHATTKTVGLSKVDEMRKRILDINPEAEVIAIHDFYTEETFEKFYEKKLDFVIDACDTIKYKIHLIDYCLRNKIKFISVMGAANKIDPTKFQIADISKTKICPLAKVIRLHFKKLKSKGKIPVVFSTESPLVPREEYIEKIGNQNSDIRKAQLPPSSNAFAPSTAGLIAASYVYRELLKTVELRTIEKNN
ncbi:MULTISPECIES: ThiF family adenylyltransferase [unclassified Gemella]|uniref:tRNA threonylcarbamoyladenosine dehydratase n=1 Tax=unclassified Gemella TaxID=2624949 RepID=UPI00107426C9|nr:MULTISPECIES: tRNA threonylcarbamoyladenosine dehydratase [unclassified Gemella]MBF0709774.1 tRNA threonylcarbamoyladenosine dehydratase [Gemella sp. GL1.1]MBF0747138.1 tRNA threonylcarbamoyladenosine dehydratase [Gemella sp. 19428wG2_WT2a]NYS27118.1 tRNA threonylcarbamoyladenosine dehydratase [Gemella sp. GL1]TFU58378.1 tRNA threonylcarbamoyladenosine dehydratase [Gemella sp. WT2a]